ncbi:hypothetical protein [Carboxylicivirga caseinilyticus]|uniref:hypothetical protein n=1 Tax=Carboxylicivirga caseinilyticus TaxID=3417572 RepID=UPI003D35553A|nr:hypothetical protein [Marinilabiliaceae bacterium A049]
MKFHLLLIIFFFGCLNLYAHREETYYLKGRLYDKEIVIQLDEYGDVCMARYITEDNLFDQTLEGKILKGGKFILTASYFDDEKRQKVITDSLFLHEIELDKWDGKWIDKNGKQSDFKLKPLLVDELNHPCVKAIKKYRVTPYLAYKTRAIQFETIKTEKIGKNIFIDYLKEPESDITWFRVKSNKKGRMQVDSINTWLEAEQLDAINMTYSCVNLGKQGKYSTSFSIHYIDNELLSYSIIINSSCYGIQEPEKKMYRTLKMANAEAVQFEELYWFGELPQPSYSPGEYQWFQYRYKIYGPKILDLLNELYPEKMNPNDNTAFSYNNVKLWQFPDWYLTPKGIYFECKSPVIIKSEESAPWSVIPYKKLKLYSTGKYKLAK